MRAPAVRLSLTHATRVSVGSSSICIIETAGHPKHPAHAIKTPALAMGHHLLLRELALSALGLLSVGELMAG